MSAIPLRRIEGKYEILEKLGEGGMGAVYKVRHRLLDDVRVIKMMRPQLVADEEFKARFQREARVAIQLRHPNIAHLIDFTIDEEDGTAFIVMEFIDGMTLEEVLRHSGPPPLGLAVEIGQQALRALACLHEKGFVHRDISPDNLMLTEDVGRPAAGQADRPRDRQDPRRRRRHGPDKGQPHRHRHLPRQGPLLLARAVRHRGGGDGRRPRRPLLVRRRPLRAADRQVPHPGARPLVADRRPPLPAAARLRRERSGRHACRRSCGR